MAGIGFVLRKLIKKQNLFGLLGAYFHAALASCGPWLFTVAALGSFFLIFRNWSVSEDIEDFRVIILYNFAFSLVFVGPIWMITTRYLADRIYLKQVDEGAGMLIGAFIVLFSFGLPIASAFYLLYSNFPLSVSLMAIVNFLIVTGIWIVSVFISTIKYYRAVTASFLIGLIIAVGAVIVVKISVG